MNNQNCKYFKLIKIELKPTYSGKKIISFCCVIPSIKDITWDLRCVTNSKVFLSREESQERFLQTACSMLAIKSKAVC